MARRFLVQRATTKEWLNTDLPFNLDGKGVETALSAAGAVSGWVAPDIGQARDKDGALILEKWKSLLYVEEEGLIRFAGIVTYSNMDGEVWSVTAMNFSTYAYGMPYDGDYSKVQVDPAAVVKHLWEHMQSKPDGDLGVTVTGLTTVRVGTEEKHVSFKAGDGSDVDFDAGPYTLSWWDSPDCGREIDSLAQETPFDWTEHHTWNADKTDVLHEIRIHYPRAGRKRTDLTFAQGQNIVSVITPEFDGDDFANEVHVIGSGEGKKSLRSRLPVRDGNLRRVKVIEAKDVTSQRRLDMIARDELNRSQNVMTINEITVIDHSNALIGSWQVGDDILVQASIPWHGTVKLWCRIIAWSLLTDRRARISLARSDSFIYGG